MIEDNPLNIENIKEKQHQDAGIQQSATRHAEWYCRKDINTVTNVLCYTKPNDDSFEECAVDLIGPWTIQVRGNPCEFNALTAIDTVTNLVELVRIDDKTSDNVTRIHRNRIPNTIRKMSH
jgi:hypothetical protein